MIYMLIVTGFRSGSFGVAGPGTYESLKESIIKLEMEDHGEDFYARQYMFVPIGKEGDPVDARH